MKNEIIIYQSDELTERIEVKLEDETVWLNQEQMALLFKQTKQNISLHINNCFKENELDRNSTVKEYLTVQNEGRRKIQRRINLYNLDVVISVGYRVKSKQGTLFRIWANQVLKDFLIKGYAVNNRMNRLEDNIETLKDKVQYIDLQIQSKLIPTQGVFFEGQVFDAYELTSRIIRSAKKSIVLIDNYIDENTLTHLSKKDKSHDRFLIIDQNAVYHLGASLKDLGKKWFAFSKLDVLWLDSLLQEIKFIKAE
jgi:DNA gyrase/topoisomerase IV subunit A